MDLNISHDNSSTLKSNSYFQNRNEKTFVSNRAYFEQKKEREDFGPGGWSVERRRTNSWELDQ
jgi:hypothetical protein